MGDYGTVCSLNRAAVCRQWRVDAIRRVDVHNFYISWYAKSLRCSVRQQAPKRRDDAGMRNGMGADINTKANISATNDGPSIGAVDLFCGIGGLTYGLRTSGIDVVAGYDLDSSCEYAYEANNGEGTFICKNVSEVTGDEINERLKDFDIKVLVGCAPCQPFSTHRKDKKHRERHKDWGLLAQFGRLAEEVMPDYISMENVPELVKESIFTDFVATLKRLGYSVTYNVVKAEEYGVPQRRRRLLLLASKEGAISLIGPTNDEEDAVTVRQAIGELPPVKAGGVCQGDPLQTASILTDINLKRIRASKPNGTWRDWPEELRLDCHKKDSGKTYPSVYGRMAWDETAPTITTQFYCYGTGRFGHPQQDRALTLREGAILQSFPADYKFIQDGEKISRKAVARHIGNAVPPKLGEAVGRSIIAACAQ